MNLERVNRASSFALQQLTALRQEARTARGRDDVPERALAELQGTLEELQVAEEELRAQSEELEAARELVELERHRYQDLFEFAPDGYLVTDGHGAIVQANWAALELLNIPASFVARKPLVSWIASEDRKAFRTRLLRLVTSLPGRPEEWELRLQRRGREFIHVSMTVAPVHDLTGNVAGLRWLLRDISERKRAEEQVRQLNAELEQRVRERTVELEAALQREQAARSETEAQRRHLEAMLEQVPEGVIIVAAPGGEVSLFNAAAEQLAGQPLGGSVVESWQIVRPAYPDGRLYAYEDWPLIRALRGETVLGAEMVVERPDGVRLVLLVSAAPITDKPGRIVAAVTVFQDITRRKTLERLKDEFLSLAAHEIKTPLTSMKTSAQALLRRAGQGRTLDASGVRMVHVINDRVDYVVGLVNELLDFARIEAGQLALHREPMDLAALLRTVVAQHQEMYPERPLQLEGAEQPVLGTWDGGRLEQVFTNLLDNAGKFSPAGSPVAVQVWPGDGTVHVAVRDQGIGIPAQDLPHLFERHFRAGNVDHSPAGLGLGLYLSCQIVQRHGGRIWAESAEGQGSTFHVELPLELPAA